MKTGPPLLTTDGSRKPSPSACSTFAASVSSSRGKRVRDGGNEGASHRASSGKAPRWYSNARTVSRRARASDRAGGVEGGGKVADVGRAVVAHGDGDHVEAAGHLAEALPLEVVLG